MKRPNIVYVLPDEFRQSALGFLNQDPVITPNINQFASEGLFLENAVSAFPVCSPYRAQLFTGQYPYSNGVIENCNTTNSKFGVYLKRNKICLSDIFSNAGYDCGYIGKWHLDPPNEPDEEYLEPRRANGQIWDAYTEPQHRHGFNFWHSYGCNDHHFAPCYWHNDATLDQVTPINEWSAKHEADIAVEYILNESGTMRDSDKPFMLFYAPNPPHMPFNQVPDKYKEQYENTTAKDLLVRPNALQNPIAEEIPKSFKSRCEAMREDAKKSVRNYFAAITGIDEQFGRILDALDQAGLHDDTIVIFTSDHGDMMGSHSLMNKSFWYDEAYKVPFIIRYPKYISPGRADFFLNAPDIMPTLLELCGLSEYLPSETEGKSLAKALFGDINCRSDEGYYVNPRFNARGVVTKEYTFVTIRDMHEKEEYILYDRKSDPYQMENIAENNPNVIKDMRKRLQRWLEHTNDLWIR